MRTYLKELAKEINIELSDEKVEQFYTYMKLLQEWNNKINLTAITEDNEIVLKHFIDSLTIQKYINEGSKVIDVGTGAGFPTIPVKICDESIKLTLLDSLNKRINFLKEVGNSLNLQDIEYVHGRTEDIAVKKEYREMYDVATARAVARLNVLAEYCIPYVKVGGVFICMKGSDSEGEINEAKNAIKVLGGKIEKVEELVLPQSDNKRTIIIIRKERNTPKNYPRKAGKPSKEPIL